MRDNDLSVLPDGMYPQLVFFQSFAEKIQVLVFKVVRLTVFGTSLETCASGEKGQNLD